MIANARDQQLRKTTLDEWFLILQLRRVKKQLHLPFFVNADITRIWQHFQNNKKPVPHTILLVKAASMLLEQFPQINKSIFHTFYGARVLEFSYNAVNMPISIKRDGRYILTATTFQNANDRSCEDIRKDLKAAATQPLDQLPINKILHSKKNTLFQRTKLRLIHFVFANFPRYYLRSKGGGISVSSIMNKKNSQIPLNMMAYGNTALTISSCTEIKQDNKVFLKVGIAFDHMACHGEIGTEAALKLVAILQASSDRDFEQLVR